MGGSERAVERRRRGSVVLVTAAAAAAAARKRAAPRPALRPIFKGVYSPSWRRQIDLRVRLEPFSSARSP